MKVGDFYEVFKAIWNLIVFILIEETGYTEGDKYYR